MKANNNFLLRIAFLLLAMLVLVVFIWVEYSEKNESPQQSAAEAALSVIHSRKSVRDFIPGRPVGEEDIMTIIKAGMAAPSGRDIRPWEIVVINDRAMLDSLAAALPHAKMLESAPLAFVVCGDTVRSAYWYLDCSAVVQNMLLAVEALGLGAVWTAAYPDEDRMNAVAESTGLPAHIRPLAVIPAGYPNGDFQQKDKFDETKIHYNRW